MNSMGADYLSIQISEEQASKIAQDLYDKKGEVKALPGEIDFNFKICFFQLCHRVSRCDT